MHDKNQKTKEYIILLVSMMLNTFCTRVVNIIDLSMLKVVSTDASASLILMNNVTFIDFVAAFTFIPILGVMLSRSENQESSLGVFFKFGVKVIILTTISCAFVYPIQVCLSINDEVLMSLTLTFEIINLVYIPFKMAQFMMGNFLCVMKFSKYVSVYSIISIPADIILNTIFIRIFGPVGCMLSTLLICFCTCIVYFSILDKKFSLIKNLKKNEKLPDDHKSFVAEFLRILFEKGTDFVLFGIILINQSAATISNIGLILSITNLLLTQSTMSMRAIAITSKTQNGKAIPYLKINLYFSVVISILFLALYRLVFNFVYKININDNQLWSSLLICIPCVIIIDSISSVTRGRMQANLKFARIFRIESIAQWTIYVPFLFMLSAINRLELFGYALIALNLAELVMYSLANIRQKSKMPTS